MGEEDGEGDEKENEIERGQQVVALKEEWEYGSEM